MLQRTRVSENLRSQGERIEWGGDAQGDLCVEKGTPFMDSDGVNPANMPSVYELLYEKLEHGCVL